MMLHAIADLVTIRNHLVLLINDRQVVQKDQFHAVNALKADIDRIFIDAIMQYDEDSLRSALGNYQAPTTVSVVQEAEAGETKASVVAVEDNGAVVMNAKDTSVLMPEEVEKAMELNSTLAETLASGSTDEVEPVVIEPAEKAKEVVVKPPEPVKLDEEKKSDDDDLDADIQARIAQAKAQVKSRKAKTTKPKSKSV